MMARHSIWAVTDIPAHIETYLASHPEPTQTDLRRLHAHTVAAYPDGRLWFDDGRNESGTVVANPDIGDGASAISNADGSSRESYRIGLSANTSGISVSVLGLDVKT